MKNWRRIFLICFVLVGSTAFFVFYSLRQLNKAFDDITASSFAAAERPPILFSDKTNKDKDKEQVPISAPETVSTPATPPETVSTPAAPTDLKLSFIFPKENDEVYIGCTYRLLFQSSAAIRLLEAELFDAGAIKAIEPDASGLARENKIAPGSQSLDWKVGMVWPGEYYLEVTNINGVDAKIYSGDFTIIKMPKDISVGEKEKICQDSGGSF